MATGYGPQIVTDSLMLCLDAANIKSYPRTGTTWFDLTTNNNNGTLVNGPTFNNANQGSIVFDGADDTASFTASTYNITNRFTIEVVCKPTATQQTGMFNFLGSVGDRGIMCHWPWSDGTLYFDINDINGNFYRWYKTGTSIVNNINMFHIYLNTSGVQEVRQNGVLLTPSGVTGAIAYNVSLGVSNTIGSFYSNGGYPWPGNMYIFKVYNRTLTESEMLQNYNAVKGRFGL